MITLVGIGRSEHEVALVAQEVQDPAAAPSGGASPKRLLARLADISSFILVLLASALAVALVAVTAPFLVVVSALSGALRKNARRGRWRAAPAL